MDKPKEIKKIENRGLQITWSDSSVSHLTSLILRKNCPSADGGKYEEAKAKKKGMLNVVESTIDESLNLKEIWPVGNYAVGIRWGDGHDTGIYTFKYLKELTLSNE